MAKRSTVLKVSGLRRAFGKNTIFSGFNLEVRTGEAVALTGRNGSGKSTLLRCLVGADRPDDGSVEVLGTPMAETSPEIRRNVATVIDDLDFFPDLSVVEHLDLLARAHGQEDPDDLVDEVLEEVQLVPQSGQLPGHALFGSAAPARPGDGLRPASEAADHGRARAAPGHRGGQLVGRAAEGGTGRRSGDRLRQSRAGAGRDGGHPGRRTGRCSRMSSSGMSGVAGEAYEHEAPSLPPARVRDLKLLIKDWRRGRATKSLWEAFHDAYIAVIAALMIGAMLTNVVLKAQTTVSQCTSVTCLSARTLLPWAAFALAIALTLAASRLFGPVLASAAEGFWLLDAPVSARVSSDPGSPPACCWRSGRVG